MTALKDYRHDLGAHLAAGLSATHAKLGAQGNPPAVQVAAGTPYVAALDYCTDSITFSVTIVTKPGDPPAVVDALDDMIDKVRSTLRTPSPGGHRYSFREVSAPFDIPLGEAALPAVAVTVVMERDAPNA